MRALGLAGVGLGICTAFAAGLALWLDQRREMLQWWANFVDSQIEEGRKVVIGRFGGAA